MSLETTVADLIAKQRSSELLCPGWCLTRFLPTFERRLWRGRPAVPWRGGPAPGFSTTIARPLRADGAFEHARRVGAGMPGLPWGCGDGSVCEGPEEWGGLVLWPMGNDNKSGNWPKILNFFLLNISKCVPPHGLHQSMAALRRLFGLHVGRTA